MVAPIYTLSLELRISRVKKLRSHLAKFLRKKYLKSAKSLEIEPTFEEKFVRNNPYRKSDYFDFAKKYIRALGKIL